MKWGRTSGSTPTSVFPVRSSSPTSPSPSSPSCSWSPSQLKSSSTSKNRKLQPELVRNERSKIVQLSRKFQFRFLPTPNRSEFRSRLSWRHRFHLRPFNLGGRFPDITLDGRGHSSNKLTLVCAKRNIDFQFHLRKKEVCISISTSSQTIWNL